MEPGGATIWPPGTGHPVAVTDAIATMSGMAGGGTAGAVQPASDPRHVGEQAAREQAAFLSQIEHAIGAERAHGPPPFFLVTRASGPGPRAWLLHASAKSAEGFCFADVLERDVQVHRGVAR